MSISLLITLFLTLSQAYTISQLNDDGTCSSSSEKFVVKGFLSSGSLVCLAQNSGYQNFFSEGNETACWDNQNGVLGDISTNCTSDCTRGSLVCAGDQNYCEINSCTNNSPCYCKIGSVKNNLIAKCSFGDVLVDNSTSWMACIDFGSKAGVLESDQYTLSPEDFTTENDGNNVIVRVMKEYNLPIVIFRKQRMSLLDNPVYKSEIVDQSSPGNKRSIAPDFSIPTSLTDEEIYLETNNGSIIIYNRPQRSHWEVSTDLCFSGACNECSGARYAACIVDNFGWMMFSIVLLAIFLTIWICIWVLCCCMRCRRDGVIPCCCCSYRIKRNKNEQELSLITEQGNVQTFNPILNPTIVLNTGSQTQNSSSNLSQFLPPQIQTVQTQPPTFPQAQPQAYLFAILIFGFGITGAFTQCTTNIISNSNVNNCKRYNNTAMVCDVKPSFTVSLGGIGNQACVTLKANSTTNFGDMTITFKDMYAIQSLNKNYHTSSFNGISESKWICYNWQWGPVCCDDMTYWSCAEYYARGGESNPCGYFSSGVLNLPGKTGCLPYPGGWNQKCFYSNDMCQYYRAALKPSGSTILISSPGLVTYNVALEIKVNTEKLKTTSSITTKTPTVNTNLFSAVLSGFFVDFGINWSGKKIGVSSDGARLVDACDPNNPIPGSLGDIQSNNADGLTNPNSNSFQFANNIISATAFATGVTVNFQGSGGNLWSNFPKFPTSYSGFNWQYNTDNTLRATINRYLNSLITITLNQPLQAFFVSDLICPSFKVDNVGGCFNCPYMAEMNITAKSTCRPGVCSLSTINGVLANTTISLGITDQKYTIYFLYGSKDYSDTITITCPEQSQSKNVSATLIDFTTIYDRANETYTSPSTGVPISLDWNPFDLKDSLSKFVLAIIIIVVVVILIIVFYYIFRCCLSRKVGKVSNKETLAVLFGQKTTKEVGYKTVDQDDTGTRQQSS